MKVLRKIKENLFLALVAFAYLIIFIAKPSVGIESVKNSGYYLKEMLMIMPVVFILTALLDLWVPKEKIVQYLGKDAKAKGMFFSFLVGSISAGPVYAAFPMCIMLYKKGATIRNIVIILSSWAVIKIPMLINEVKFLGLKFMIVRWVLTVIAIIVFSWLTEKMIKEKDLPETALVEAGLHINEAACIGCTLCVQHYDAVFAMKNNKAVVKPYETLDKDKLNDAITICPVKAISYREAG